MVLVAKNVWNCREITHKVNRAKWGTEGERFSSNHSGVLQVKEANIIVLWPSVAEGIGVRKYTH